MARGSPPPARAPAAAGPRSAEGPAVGRPGAAAAPPGSSAIGCRRAAPSTAGSASASARARRPPQFTPRGQSSPASRPALAPCASAYLQVQVALVEPAAVLVLEHRQDEDLVLLQHPRHAVLRARARGGVRSAPRRGPRRLPRPRPPRPRRRVPRRRPGRVRPARPLHAARGAARAGPRPRPRLRPCRRFCRFGLGGGWVECFRRVKTGGEGRARGRYLGKSRSPGSNASRGTPDAVTSGPPPPRRAALAPAVHPAESLRCLLHPARGPAAGVEERKEGLAAPGEGNAGKGARQNRTRRRAPRSPPSAQRTKESRVKGLHRQRLQQNQQLPG